MKTAQASVTDWQALYKVMFTIILIKRDDSVSLK